MRPLLAVMLGITLNAPVTVAQEGCPCRPYPFEPDPPCYKQCVKIIAQRADLNALQETLGLSEKMVADITADRASGASEISQGTVDMLEDQLRRVGEHRVQDFLEMEKEIFYYQSERSEMKSEGLFGRSLEDERYQEGDLDSLLEGADEQMIQDGIQQQSFE